jgi:hypothetical protein
MSPNLNGRIGRLEHTLGALPCTCPNSSDLSWPGHHPDPHCPTCGGQRLIYPLPHHPRRAEPLIRQALPIIKKAYGTNYHADLNTLTDHELDQVKTALQAVQQAGPTNTRSPTSKAERS